MAKESGATLRDHRDEDEDDDDEYEETDGGNRLLGFMFGNVDDAGDLDVDYLDEDAKEHLAALADKLGSSLTDIDLSIKSSQTPADPSEQDYDEKAEDAVNYEDIDEQYEGPETHAFSEEDHLLPQKEYISSGLALSAMERNSVFDEENYDEDEDFHEEDKVVDNGSELQTIASEAKKAGKLDELNSPPRDVTTGQSQPVSPEKDENLDLFSEEEKSLEDFLGPFEDENFAVDLEDFQDEPDNLQEPSNIKSETPLPVLCIEDGMVVLKFSEIFGIHEPLKKGEKRNHRHPVPKELYRSLDASDIVEEDEEAFLRGSCHGLFLTEHAKLTQYDSALVEDGDSDSAAFNFQQRVSTSLTQGDVPKNNFCLFAEPMKESVTVYLAAGWDSPSCPKFYPLDQQEWEDEIIWGNSPLVSHGPSESCTMSELDPEAFSNTETELEVRPPNLISDVQMEPNEKDHSLFLRSCPVSVEPFGSRKNPDPTNFLSSKYNHPQVLRLESHLGVDDSNYSEGRKESDTEHIQRSDGSVRNFSKLSLQNIDMLEDSWLNKIIWDSNEFISKPKLILDLQDDQMLFEIFDTQDVGHLRLHAGAMIVTRSVKANGGDSFDLPGQGAGSVGRFNISNDKYYSNRKTSQQLKSHSKKRAAHGVKVLHSIPALKLQTMKAKLSNKDIANFHRPKALWYPHDNKVAAKEQGKLSTQGPMKIILRSIGGKGSKLHVDAEETVLSVKAKASKKLDFKPTEKVQIFYSGKELEDGKSLAEENVKPNSVLHLVRTKIHLWPRAQKLPGENKSLRPPGAFRKKSDLSVKDGHVFLMEYCEERPLLLGNVGMGARLCTYYQKLSPGDQTASSLRNEGSLGSVLTLDPADKSPFLGDIKPGCSQSCLETNMYRAPIFPHRLSSTDYLLVRSSKGKLSLRRIDRVDAVGQQEPHMEVISPGTKNLQTYVGNRLLVYIYREFRATEKRGLIPCVRADELSAQFSNMSEPFLRKRLKHCAELQKGLNGQLFWVMRRNFRIPLEEELRRMVPPENVCAYESMQAGLYRLKRLGISRLTHPNGLFTAMNQLPDEAIALAAASHIERELQITPWNLSSNFVACTNQDRENIERLEITGVGDPSGRGLGFSYVRVAPKAPLANAVVKKKAIIPRGASTVTGTDADLRRLSMDAAREVLLKFNVSEEQISKQTRWHRIAMIRKLSSEQAASGQKVDPTTISKYARGQRMSFLQLQQQTREKCQEIWDRQVVSLSAADGDENDSDSEPNSDLDSFAGDLENLLDAEECGAVESNYESKMRRHSSQPQADEKIEDEAAEAAELCRMLMDDDESELRKKKNTGPGGRDLGLGWQSGFASENAEQIKKTNTTIKQIIRRAQPDGSFTSTENIISDPKQVEQILAKRALSGKAKANRKNDIQRIGLLTKKTKAMGDGIKIIKEKRYTDKPVRECFACGACGQIGHMRTNKNCPRYGEDLDSQIETIDPERASGKSSFPEPSTLLPQKTPIKKLVTKAATKISSLETPDEFEKAGSKTKGLQLKVKCGPADKIPENITSGGSQSSDRLIAADADSRTISGSKINKIVFSKKTKPDDIHVEPSKPAIKIRPPVDIDREQQQPPRKIKFKTNASISVDQFKQEVNFGLQEDDRKYKKSIELSSLVKYRKQESAKRKANERRWIEEEEEERKKEKEKRRIEEGRRLYEQEIERIHEEQRWKEEQKKKAQREEAEIRRQEAEIRRHDAMLKEEQERRKAKKIKMKKRPEMIDDYLEEQRPSRNDRRLPERNRTAKRRPTADLGRYAAEYAPQTKRRRGGAGEVGLANILESIVDRLKEEKSVSYLFVKPVTKKEAPDYLDIIKQPMDLSTIKEKVRKMEYKSREDFRHDVWQITFNAHRYNDGRYPAIPPLADQLLELCDYMLIENDRPLTEAEAGIVDI